MSHVIDVDTTDAVEMGALPAGEYKVQVLKAEFREGEGKAGHWEGILLTLDCPDEITGDIFSHMEFIPVKGDDAKRYQRALGQFGRFKAAFGFGQRDKITEEELQGREAWAHLVVDQDPEYGDRNKVRSWIVSQA